MNPQCFASIVSAAGCYPDPPALGCRFLRPAVTPRCGRMFTGLQLSRKFRLVGSARKLAVVAKEKAEDFAKE